jgi:hypothetical protein
MYQILLKKRFIFVKVLKSNKPQSSIGDEVFTTTDDDGRGFDDDEAVVDVIDEIGDCLGCDFGRYSSMESSKKISINVLENNYNYLLNFFHQF